MKDHKQIVPESRCLDTFLLLKCDWDDDPLMVKNYENWVQFNNMGRKYDVNQPSNTQCNGPLLFPKRITDDRCRYLSRKFQHLQYSGSRVNCICVSRSPDGSSVVKQSDALAGPLERRFCFAGLSREGGASLQLCVEQSSLFLRSGRVGSHDNRAVTSLQG